MKPRPPNPDPRKSKKEKKPVTAQPIGGFVLPGGYYRRFPTSKEL